MLGVHEDFSQGIYMLGLGFRVYIKYRVCQ